MSLKKIGIVVCIIGSVSFIQVAGVVLSCNHYVYASQLNYVKEANIKLDNLVKKLETKYLDPKNKMDILSNINTIKKLIDKIPNGKRNEKDILTKKINNIESLFQLYLEAYNLKKSFDTIQDGGLGNHRGMANAEKWIEISEKIKRRYWDIIFECEKMYMADFIYLTSYNIRIMCGEIEANYRQKYDKVVDLLRISVKEKDKEKAKIALQLAKKLESSKKTKLLIRDINNFIDNKLIMLGSEYIEVKFEDKGLELRVRRELYNYKDKIYAIDCESVEELYNYDGSKPIESIEGLQYFKNLKNLNLGHQNIKDLSPLKGLNKIERLNISYNRKNTNYNSISGLKSLKILDIEYCNIDDLKFLYGLDKLEEINININPVSNVEVLNQLENLKIINAGNCNIKRIKIDRLRNLEELNLSGNEVSDLNQLQQLQKIKKLNLSRNPIEKIEMLKNLKTLNSLYIDECKIKDISPVKGLDQLEYLYLSKNMIDDISSIGNLKKLKYLYMNNNNIENLQPIEKMINLEHLDIGYNK
ncbi:MAG: leucine-rich repeat domain-containing protein, partial [Clostridium sp.]